jgi:hypothetical protein
MFQWFIVIGNFFLDILKKKVAREIFNFKNIFRINPQIKKLFEKLIEKKKAIIKLSPEGKVFNQIKTSIEKDKNMDAIKNNVKSVQQDFEKLSDTAKKLIKVKGILFAIDSNIEIGAGSDGVSSQWITRIQWVPKDNENFIYDGTIIVNYMKNKVDVGGSVETVWNNQNLRLYLNFLASGSKGNFYLTWFSVSKPERVAIAKQFKIGTTIQETRFGYRVGIQGQSKNLIKSFKSKNSLAQRANRPIRKQTQRALGGIRTVKWKKK